VVPFDWSLRELRKLPPSHLQGDSLPHSLWTLRVASSCAKLRFLLREAVAVLHSSNLRTRGGQFSVVSPLSSGNLSRIPQVPASAFALRPTEKPQLKTVSEAVFLISFLRRCFFHHRSDEKDTSSPSSWLDAISSTPKINIKQKNNN